MKTKLVFLFFIFSLTAFAQSTLDVNITYESGVYKVKETVCGQVPDLSLGFSADENGCFGTRYSLNEPVYGFSFTPKAGISKDISRAAFYITYFGINPDAKKLHSAVMKDDKKTGQTDTLFHDNTYQGVAELQAGEYLKLYSDSEKVYDYAHAVLAVLVIIGIFLYIRRRR